MPKIARSLTIPLAMDDGDAVGIIAQPGIDRAQVRSLLITFGPLSGMVLSSLREVGLPARRWEWQELRRLVESPSLVARRTGVERAILMWRVLALFGHVSEDLAALSSALNTWHKGDRPRGTACHIGRDFLTWQTTTTQPVRDVLAYFATVDAAERLLMYPRWSHLTPRHISPHRAKLIRRLCRRSAAAVASYCARAAELSTPEVQRTFVRWKHRLSATSPSLVPVFMPAQDEKSREEIGARFASGFGVIDWRPGKLSEPELILWPAEGNDFETYGSAVEQGIQMLTALVDATLRMALEAVPVLPWLIDEADRPLTNADKRALEHLERSAYRLWLGLDVT